MKDRNIQRCKLWCENGQLAELGVDNNHWSPFAFDWNNVTSIHENTCGEEETPATTLYIDGDRFTVNIPFSDALILFEDR